MTGHINKVAEKNINQILKELDIYDDIYNKPEVTEVLTLIKRYLLKT